MTNCRPLARAVFALMAVGWVAIVASPTQLASAASFETKVDINRDGVEDQVVGHRGSRQVFVRLSSSGSTWSWKKVTLDTSGALLGEALATCDVNNDGFTDVAAGGALAQDTSGDSPGAVYVMKGSATGLGAPTKISQQSPNVPGTSEAGDLWGLSLACGRIGTDPYADLVVGSPGEAIGSLGSAGSITVLPGSASGITTTGSYAVNQDTEGVDGAAESGDFFGEAVAVADVTGDGLAEIVVGSPGENNGAGYLSSLRGSTTGWTASGSTAVTGSSVAATGGFGSSLAVGRFAGGTGLPSVAVGSSGSVAGGSVTVLRPGSGNLTATGARVMTQNSGGVPGTGEIGDAWGADIASGDVTGDGVDDLLVGAPGEAVGSRKSAGMISLLRGSATGLTGTGSQSISQDSTGVPGTAEAEDVFGQRVTLSDTNNDGRKDAFVGAPGETVGSASYAGALTILRGSAAGLTAAGSTALSADSASGTAVTEGAFGSDVG